MIGPLKRLHEYIRENSKEYESEVKGIIAYAGKKKKKKALYTGAFLSETGKETLREWWAGYVKTPFLENEFMHHMTIKYRPSEEEVSSVDIGQEIELQIVGYAEDEMGQSVLIAPPAPPNRRTVGSHHITVATGTMPPEAAQGGSLPDLSPDDKKRVSPAYSKELLEKADAVKVVAAGPMLKARIGFVASGRVDPQYDFKGTIYDIEEVELGD